jgi:hypothetical protein
MCEEKEISEGPTVNTLGGCSGHEEYGMKRFIKKKSTKSFYATK